MPGWFDAISGAVGSGYNNVLDFFGGGSQGYTPPDIYRGASYGTAPDASLGNLDTNTDFSPSASPASGGGGGWRGVLNTVGDVAKVAAPIAGIGSSVLGGITAVKAGEEAAHQGKLQERAQKQREQMTGQAAAAAAPLTAFGKDELERASRGELPPAAEANIQRWIDGARQLVKSRLGPQLANSSALDMWEDWIQQEAMGMRNTELQRMQSMGTQALTQGGGILNQSAGQEGQAAGQAGSNVSAIDSLIQNANQQLAKLGAAA